MLQEAPNEHPVFLTEPPLNPIANREKATQIMFETFNTPAAYIAVTSVLSLFASGRTSGAMLDSGEGASFVVPIHNGFALPHAVQRMDVAGCDLTRRMEGLLAERHGNLFPEGTARASIESVARGVKERLGRVALDYDNEASATKDEAIYELPDGRVITVGNERFQCAEALFQPSLLLAHLSTKGQRLRAEEECLGLHEALYLAISKCDLDIHAGLYSGVVLAGGSSLFPGLDDRLQKELSALAPPATVVSVLAPGQRKDSAWVGGSTLASMPSFTTRWITSEEYDENGPALVHRKCW